MTLKVRPACAGDVDELAPRLREADRREVKAAIGEEPYVVLERSVAWSDPCFAVVDDEDRPLALFGAVPASDRPNVGIVWLLGSTDLMKHPFYILRNSREWVERLQQRYPLLWNCVDARNEVHIRWLKWCGFTFLRLIEDYGVEHRPFYEFQRARDSDSFEKVE